ncbi:hypothetical protein ACFL6R_06590 [Gemmatimonadota bacterium]
MTTIALRDTPLPRSIFLNQARSILFRLRWDALFIGVVTFILHFGSVQGFLIRFAFWGTAPGHQLMLFNEGAIGSGLLWLFLLFSGFWAFRTWEIFNNGNRSSFLTYPADHSWHRLIRAAAGAAVFLALVASAWVLGATASEIFTPGRSWFTFPTSSGPGWIISVFGMLNVYLYATALSMLFRRPEIWFLVWIPVTILFLAGTFNLSGLEGALEVMQVTLGWPFGVLAGFGFPESNSASGFPLPKLGVVLMWTAIFGAGVYLVSRIHRED